MWPQYLSQICRAWNLSKFRRKINRSWEFRSYAEYFIEKIPNEIVVPLFLALIFQFVWHFHSIGFMLSAASQYYPKAANLMFKSFIVWFYSIYPFGCRFWTNFEQIRPICTSALSNIFYDFVFGESQMKETAERDRWKGQRKRDMGKKERKGKRKKIKKEQKSIMIDSLKILTINWGSSNVVLNLFNSHYSIIPFMCN